MDDWAAVQRTLGETLTRRLGLTELDGWRSQLPSALKSCLGKTVRPGCPEYDGEILLLADRLSDEGLENTSWQEVIAAATIGETRFLRERLWFQQVDRLALAKLIGRRRREGRKALHIWSAGCSSGEEAYTLALLLKEHLPDFDEWQIDILGTDIRAEAIRTAASGLYEARQLRELDHRQIDAFFTRVDETLFSVIPGLRRCVRFRLGNLLSDAVQSVDNYGSFDLIVCRNVLIYMVPDAQRQIAQYLGTMLARDGWLVTSPAEASADWFKPLSPVNAEGAILFVKHSGANVMPAHANKVPPDSVPGLQPRLQTDKATAPRPATQSSVRVKTRAKDNADAVQHARNLADRGRLEEAQLHCREILASDSLDNDAAFLLAEICAELNDHSAAYKAARHAVYIAPGSPRAHFMLAGALSRLGQKRRALKALITARSLAAGETSPGIDR